jgi:hypothetical protein
MGGVGQRAGDVREKAGGRRRLSCVGSGAVLCENG